MSLLLKEQIFNDVRWKTNLKNISAFWRPQQTSDQNPKYKMAKISTVCFLLYNHRLQRKYRVAAEILRDFNEKMCK
jgi:hypothetical protein